ARFERALIRLPLDPAREDVEHALSFLQFPRAPVGAGNSNDAMDRKVLRACGRGVHNGLNPRALGAFPTDGYRRDSSRYRWPRLRLRLHRVVHDDGRWFLLVRWRVDDEHLRRFFAGDGEGVEHALRAKAP